MKLRLILLPAIFQILTGLALADSQGVFLKAQKENHTVYLFGSIHVASEDMYPIDDQVITAFKESEALYLELAITGNEQHIANVVNQASLLEKGQTLEKIVSKETYQKAKKAAEALNTPIELFQYRQPWYFSVVLSELKMMALGYSAHLGIDLHFQNLANRLNKPTFGLETPEQQIDFLTKAMGKDSDFVLTQTIADLENLDSMLGPMIKHWKAGEDNKLGALVLDELNKYPDMKTWLLDKRNLNWSNFLMGLKNKKPIFVVVGAAHLLGPNSLPNYLESEGYTLTKY